MNRILAANPHLRIQANAQVAIAVRAGKITRPSHCEDCGVLAKQRVKGTRNYSGTLSAHHDDYAKPLDIAWLCKPCHMKRHCPGLTTPMATFNIKVPASVKQGMERLAASAGVTLTKYATDLMVRHLNPLARNEEAPRA